MNNSGMSFASAITSTRSYGATHSRMLTEIDTNLITYHLKPTDTLQGLSIRYGVTVEKLKRINKLWSNESILAKETLLIPSQDICKTEQPNIKTDKTELYVKPDHNDEFKHTGKSKRKVDNQEDGELGSSLKENDDVGDNTSNKDSSLVKDYDQILANADCHINAYKQQRGEGSEAFQAFNDILSNIDKTIADHKDKTKVMTATQQDLPAVGYDGNYQNVNPVLFSPTRQHPYLEQGT